MKTLTLPAFEVRQNGAVMLLTKVRAGDLGNFTKIDPYDSSKTFDDADQGYQRPPEDSRIRKLGNWLKNELESGTALRMPTALVLSGRGSDLSLSSSGTITLKESNKLPIIDGQHRKRGFEYAIYDKNVEALADFEVPVVIMKDVDKITEMKQFRIVNGTAKSVRTDLVNMLLTQLAEVEGEETIKDTDLWRVVVSHVVKRLNDDESGPWYDKIVMPDKRAYTRDEIAEDETLRHRRIARATSFMTSLKGLENFISGVLHDDLGTVEQREEWLFEVVNSFWSALREINPDCFEMADDFVMQKTPGIFALHKVCGAVARDMYQGRRAFEKKEFVHMLGNSAELQDSNYWYVGTPGEPDRGEAAKYGSMKGFAELAEMLIDGLKP